MVEWQGNRVRCKGFHQTATVKFVSPFNNIEPQRVAKGSEGVFDQVGMCRGSHRDKVPGFKGPKAEDHTLYFSDGIEEPSRL